MQCIVFEEIHLSRSSIADVPVCTITIKTSNLVYHSIQYIFNIFVFFFLFPYMHKGQGYIWFDVFIVIVQTGTSAILERER
jgi:hypothetical protein